MSPVTPSKIPGARSINAAIRAWQRTHFIDTVSSTRITIVPKYNCARSRLPTKIPQLCQRRHRQLPMQTRTLRLVVMMLTLTVLGIMPSLANAQADKREAKIAEEAFIYGFPLVMNYAVFYQYFVDKSDP